MKLQQDNIPGACRLFVISLLLLSAIPASGQPDVEPPLPPLFTMLAINQSTDRTELEWELSASPDVAGYVVYSYKNYEGIAIDTIFDPGVTSYSVWWPWSLIRSESFVIAAIDYSGNISPLSNNLHTIFIEIALDTCNSKIDAVWNTYSSYPRMVTRYDVFVSVNGGSYEMAGQTQEGETEFVLDDFITDAHYCFFVQARLDNGQVSGSNKPCLDTEMLKSPLWINADYATVTPSGEISLSFTVGPDSEIELFSLERRTGDEGNFREIARIRSSERTVTFFDNTAEAAKINSYRLSALNNCGIATISSNIASNIVLTATESDNDIMLLWNQYRGWLGVTSPYRLFMDTGSGFNESAVFQPNDTVHHISIPEIMFNTSGSRICFYISVSEASNPYGISGVSVSNIACFNIEERVVVPNVFSPDGDLINDLFRPVITFTPVSYQLIITDRQRKILFESRDFTTSWDGTDSGNPLPQGVYLWFLKVVAPSGKNISRSGTLTLIKNR